MGIWSRYLEVEKRLFKAAGHVERERETFSAMFVFVIVVVLGIGKGDSYIRIQI